MRKSILAAVAAATIVPTVARASIVYWGDINLTTAPNAGGPLNDGTGVWFNPYTGYAEARGFFFPSPLFEDGKFLLALDASFATPEAEIWTEGFFSNGNHVIGSASGNPARLSAGDAIDASTGSAAVYTDLGPTFGNWSGGGQGYVPLVLGGSSIHYGYAEISVDKTTYAITLNAFAYETLPNTAIVAGAIPEPTSALFLAAGASIALPRHRRAWKRR